MNNILTLTLECKILCADLKAHRLGLGSLSPSFFSFLATKGYANCCSISVQYKHPCRHSPSHYALVSDLDVKLHLYIFFFKTVYLLSYTVT